MARRFTVRTFELDGFDVRLKFESEQLNEDGSIITPELLPEIYEIMQATFADCTGELPEAVSEKVHTAIHKKLCLDKANVYSNLMGHEYQRTKLVSVELAKDEIVTIYED